MPFFYTYEIIVCFYRNIGFKQLLKDNYLLFFYSLVYCWMNKKKMEKGESY